MFVTLYKVELKNTYYDIDMDNYERNLLKELGYTLRKDPSVALGVYNKPISLKYGSDEYKQWDSRRESSKSIPFYTQADYPQWESETKSDSGITVATFTPEKFADFMFNSFDKLFDMNEVSRQTIQVDHPLEGFFNDFSKTLSKQLGKELIKMTKGE